MNSVQFSLNESVGAGKNIFIFIFWQTSKSNEISKIPEIHGIKRKKLNLFT